jgi:hypothetical protein
MIWLALVECQRNYYLMMHDDRTNIQAFETLEKGLDFFERGYNTAHSRSYESSMSACFNWLVFKPSIVSAKDLDEIKTWVGPEPRATRISHPSGFMLGIAVLPEFGQKLWESWSQPKLIDPDRLEHDSQ